MMVRDFLFVVVFMAAVVGIGLAVGDGGSQAPAAVEAGESAEQWEKPANWHTIKSPKTGRCYELLIWHKQVGNTSHSEVGYAGLGSEVPCDTHEQDN